MTTNIRMVICKCNDFQTKIFGYSNYIFYLCCTENELSRTCSIGKLISIFNSETSSRCQWRAAPFGACIAQRITKTAKHSKPVTRSLFISSVRLSLIYQSGNLKRFPLFLSPLYTFFISHLVEIHASASINILTFLILSIN